MFVGTAPQKHNWHCWLMFAASCPNESPFCWWVTPNLALMEVLRCLDEWHWDYVLRQKTSTHVCLAHQTQWRDFGSWVEKPGGSIWLGRGWLAESEFYPVNLLAHWKIGEKEPWCLATNLPDRQTTLRAYSRRMWTEEMFGEMKNMALIWKVPCCGMLIVCLA